MRKASRETDGLVPAATDEVPGLAVRRIAADMVDGVSAAAVRSTNCSTPPASSRRWRSATARSRARWSAPCCAGSARLRHLLGPLLDRGLPPQAPRVETALLIGAAQILFLDVPDHAAVDLSVRLVQADRQAAHFAGLVNAVLRRVAREGKARARRRSTCRRSIRPTGCWRGGPRLTARRPRTPSPRRTATNRRST